MAKVAKPSVANNKPKKKGKSVKLTVKAEVNISKQKVRSRKKKKMPTTDGVKIKKEVVKKEVIKKEPLNELSTTVKVENGMEESKLKKSKDGLATNVKGKKNKKRGKKITDSKKHNMPSTGVVYVEHLPHGFYEDELKGYFGQFGPVTGVYVPRSKVTGRAKGFGFIQFTHNEVAKIAAETMNNYLMFNRLLKTKLVPPEEQKPHMFLHKFRAMKPGNNIHAAVKHRNRKLKDSEQVEYIKKATQKLASTKRKLKALGCDYSILVKNPDGSVSTCKIEKFSKVISDSSESAKSSSPPKIKTPKKGKKL